MKRMMQILLVLMLATFGYSQEIEQTPIIPEVVIEGTGEINLLLISCMSCRWNAWEEFMERNAEKYTMYAVTLPGYGGTALPDLPMNSGKTPWRDNVLVGLSGVIDEHQLTQVVVVGHSWGAMVAVQLGALRKDVVSQVISVDGTIESTSWTPATNEERLAQAESVIADWEPKLKSAEGWSKFNGASVGKTIGKSDSVTTERMLTRIKLISSFMATSPDAVLQYWRENPLIDLTAALHQIAVPILDIQSFTGADQQGRRRNILKRCK